MKAWVTRPILDAVSTAEKIEKAGLDSWIFPLINIENYELGINQAFQLINNHEVSGLVVTSINAARIIIDKFSNAKELPIYTSGDSSADILHNHGFINVISAHKDSAQLINLLKIQEITKDKNLLYLSGDPITASLEDIIPNVIRVIIYKSVAANSFNSQTIELIKQKQFSHILFFSSHTARIFVQLVTELKLNHYFNKSMACCLSDNIASNLKILDFSKIKVAEAPREDELIKLVFSLSS